MRDVYFNQDLFLVDLASVKFTKKKIGKKITHARIQDSEIYLVVYLHMNILQ